MKTALIHDWLVNYAGSEKVVEEILNVLPRAPIYTLFYQPEKFKGTRIAGQPVFTSGLERLPLAHEQYQTYLPFMPYAIEQFNLDAYDLIVSSSHAVAKGVRVNADQLHISYVHTPIRYVWDLYQQYLQETGLNRGTKGRLARALLHYVRLWDSTTANRVDVFLANSHYVAKRIWRTYRRPAKVLYPPVDIGRFDATQPREDFYLAMSRFAPYKKMDLIAETFTHLGRPLVMIGDGPERPRVAALAGPNITFLGRQPDEVVADYMARCSAFVFAADEDFGIVPVEAQAAGAPVLAFGKGGALETIINEETGLFFSEQSVASLTDAVMRFEAGPSLDAQKCRRNAERFGPERFRTEFKIILSTAQAAFREGENPEAAVMALDMEHV